MANAVAHFEIYGDKRAKLADFYSGLFAGATDKKTLCLALYLISAIIIVGQRASPCRDEGP